MWDHLILGHLKIPKHENGKWDFTDKPGIRYACRWKGCKRYPGEHGPWEVGYHIKQHLPETRGNQKKPTAGPVYIQDAVLQTHVFYNTAVDERGDAAGLPLTAALVLRNLARNLPRPIGGDDEEPSWSRKLFTPVMPQIWHIMAHNKPLATYMTDLIEAISAAE